MLFKQSHLNGIKDESITLAFRKWKSPAVKKGSIIKTSIGMVEILAIDPADINRITPKDARDAGFEQDTLLRQLQAVATGTVYKIKLRYAGADPRIQLRQQTALTDEAYTAIIAKLASLDKHSKTGSWTKQVLLAIQAHPALRAADLAIITRKEKEWLKLNIRKLKNLGLTISHDIGYTISPLGALVLQRMQ